MSNWCRFIHQDIYDCDNRCSSCGIKMRYDRGEYNDRLEAERLRVENALLKKEVEKLEKEIGKLKKELFIERAYKPLIKE